MLIYLLMGSRSVDGELDPTNTREREGRTPHKTTNTQGETS